MTAVHLSIRDLPDLPSVVFRINREWREGLTEGQIYERVRRYWRAQPERRPEPPIVAYGVAHGIIRAAYWIDGWERYDMAKENKDSDRADIEPHPPGRRIAFVGRGADELTHLVGLILTDLPKGQNPVTYVRGSGSAPTC